MIYVLISLRYCIRWLGLYNLLSGLCSIPRTILPRRPALPARAQAEFINTALRIPAVVQRVLRLAHVDGRVAKGRDVDLDGLAVAFDVDVSGGEERKRQRYADFSKRAERREI